MDTIVRITSGLGNQLFQYSKGLSLQRAGGSIFFDTSWYLVQAHRPRRHFRLAEIGLMHGFRYGVRLKAASVAALARFDMGRRLVGSVFGVDMVTEVNPDAASESSRLQVVSGYWQKGWHVLENAPSIRDRICLPGTLSTDFQARLAENRAGSSAFIHVRRGDYLRWKVETIGEEYVSNALREIAERFPEISGVYLLSDDHHWANKIRATHPQLRRFEHSERDREMADLLFMSSCRGGVIANSSFSYWGAALMKDPLFVMAPSMWTHPSVDINSLYFPGWIILNFKTGRRVGV
jgi:hypothetical protein